MLIAPAVDMTASVIDHAKPKTPAERRLAGTSMRRIDLAAKAAGPGFIHDIELPGLLHGRTLDPPASGRRLETFDEAALTRAFPTVQIVRDGGLEQLLCFAKPPLVDPAQREEVAQIARDARVDLRERERPLEHRDRAVRAD